MWLVNELFVFYVIWDYLTMLSTERDCKKFMLKRIVKPSRYISS